jgi:hypothetical protein
MPDERKESALGFLQRALDWLAQQGVTVERVMTDMVRPIAAGISARQLPLPAPNTNAPGRIRRAPTQGRAVYPNQLA